MEENPSPALHQKMESESSVNRLLIAAPSPRLFRQVSGSVCSIKIAAIASTITSSSSIQSIGKGRGNLWGDHFGIGGRGVILYEEDVGLKAGEKGWQ